MIAISHSKAGPSHAGVGLVEVMIAIFVLSVCISGTAWLIVAAKNAGDQARNHYVAANLARNRMERARTLDYEDLDLFAQSETVVDENGNADADGDYRITTTVTDAASNGLKEVVVVVEVRDRMTYEFTDEQESLRTYIANFQMPEYGE